MYYFDIGLYWSERALVYDLGYEPVDVDGKVYGYPVCQKGVVQNVCKKRRDDYINTSKTNPFKLPIWC